MCADMLSRLDFVYIRSECMCVNVETQTYAYERTHTHTHTNIHTRVHTLHTYKHTDIHAYTPTNKRRVNTCIHSYMNAYKHTCTHTRTRIHARGFDFQERLQCFKVRTFLRLNDIHIYIERSIDMYMYTYVRVINTAYHTRDVEWSRCKGKSRWIFPHAPLTQKNIIRSGTCLEKKEWDYSR